MSDSKFVLPPPSLEAPEGWTWSPPASTTHEFRAEGRGKSFCWRCGIAEWAATSAQGSSLLTHETTFHAGPTLWAGPHCPALASEDKERCERCGGRLLTGVSIVAYECEQCGRWFDHHLNPVRKPLELLS